jgi:hypothetical protein
MKRVEVAQYWEANAEIWTRQARAGYEIYRDGLNTPAFQDMLPPVLGLHLPGTFNGLVKINP